LAVGHNAEQPVDIARVPYRFLDDDGVIYGATDPPLCPRLSEVVTITDDAGGEALGPFKVLNVWHDLRRSAGGGWTQTVDILVRRPDATPAGFRRPS